eukprot:gene12709-17045_t
MSKGVFLNNLDDFIAPSQACVNPMVVAKMDGSSSSTARIVLATDFTTLDYEDDQLSGSSSNKTKKPNLILTKGNNENKKVAQVSLNDCLACSGCVTSAETMLIQEQSYEKLIEKLEQNDSVIVVAISPNSLVSIANFLNIEPTQLFLVLASFLKSIGVHYVVDTSSASDIGLIESREEFMHRFLGNGKKENKWEKPLTTTALSSTSISLYSEDDPTHPITRQVGHPTLSDNLPMLSSNCPGWVCYAEKTQPQSLPYVSSVKSPQQILGVLIKQVLNEKMKTIENNKKSVYVVSIQPCFDKKLEASRR